MKKFAVLFVALVTGALVASGLVEIYFSFQESKTALLRIQREKAEAAAKKPARRGRAKRPSKPTVG